MTRFHTINSFRGRESLNKNQDIFLMVSIVWSPNNIIRQGGT